MAPTIVGQTTGSIFTLNLHVNYNSTAGNTLIAFCGHQSRDLDNSAPTITMTDTAGNVWTRATAIVGATAQRAGSIWYCRNAKAVTQVTMTSTASGSTALIMTLLEMTPLGIVRPGSVGSLVSAFTTTPANAPVQAEPGDFVVGLGMYQGAGGVRLDTIAAGNPFSLLSTTNYSTTYETAAYWGATASGLTAPTWALSSAATIGEATVAFTPLNNESWGLNI